MSFAIWFQLNSQRRIRYNIARLQGCCLNCEQPRDAQSQHCPHCQSWYDLQTYHASLLLRGKPREGYGTIF